MNNRQVPSMQVGNYTVYNNGEGSMSIYRCGVFIAALENTTASCDLIYKMATEIALMQKQLRQATGCLALYLEAADMIAVQSCNKGTIEFLNSLENKDE